MKKIKDFEISKMAELASFTRIYNRSEPDIARLNQRIRTLCNYYDQESKGVLAFNYGESYKPGMSQE